MKQAVCALIPMPDNKVLGVSRKNNPNDFGLPGGKVDEGESEVEALFREIKEETGLKITEFKFILSRQDNGFSCSTYLCKVEGEIQSDEKGVVKAVTWEDLFNGTFKEYNKNLYNVYTNTK